MMQQQSHSGAPTTTTAHSPLLAPANSALAGLLGSASSLPKLPGMFGAAAGNAHSPIMGSAAPVLEGVNPALLN